MAKDIAEQLQRLMNAMGKRNLARCLNIGVGEFNRYLADPTSLPSEFEPILDSLELPERSDKGTFRFIDLFAGIGGTRQGFENAGGTCVFTSERDIHANATYRSNFHELHPINGDITNVDERDVPDHDVLVAGFPCQPFSLAGVSKKNSLGRKHGFEDATQGTLFFDVARILKEKQPPAFMLENVKNLRSHDKGKTFQVISDTLAELGYYVQSRVIDAKGWVPQHRERIFIVGFKDGSKIAWDRAPLGIADEDLHHPREDAFDLNAVTPPTQNTRVASVLQIGDSAQTIFHDNGRFADPLTGKTLGKYTLTDNLWRYLQDYKKKHDARGNGFGFGLVSPADPHTRTISARYHKDGSEILIAQEGENPRRLSPREAARLMGFPDSFIIPVSDTQAYRQFGNSVVVPLIEDIARGIAAQL